MGKLSFNKLYREWGGNLLGSRQAECDCRHTHVRKLSVIQLAKAKDDVDEDDDDVGCVISVEAKK